MGWADDVIMSYELGGRAASDLREEASPTGRRLITDLIQHRIEHTHGHWRWPMPDPDLEFEGEVVMRQWQMARCCGMRSEWAYGPLTRRCENDVRLSQPEAAAKAQGEAVEVYCSWCSYDLERGKSNIARMTS